MKNNTIKIISAAISFISFIGNPLSSFAQENTPVKAAGNAFFTADNLPRYLLIITCALFLIIIAVLAKAIKVAGKNYFAKLKEETKNANKVTPLLILFLLGSSDLFAAAESNAPATDNPFSNLDLYLMSGAVLILFIAVLSLVKALFVLMGVKAAQTEALTGEKVKVKTLFQRLNNTVAIEDEDSLDLQHDYDGIRELDNKVPSWWSWTFFASAMFGVIYIYRMFGAENLPKQLEELAQANTEAEIAKEAYLKKNANMVDENTVVMLTGGDLAAGAALYTANCLACHGDKGQGGVGPNLTDDYWLHKGGIKDIFYTVKYGWQEKGMKSWQNDLSPLQIAQVSSFVKTLHGTNPPNPKDKQGELYSEVSTVKDSLTTDQKPAADSLKK
jgi:cytochrome c oxidase cbb3-type subunit 3